MSNIYYESNIGGYSFLMNTPTTIEVWIDSAGEYPDNYITVKEGSIKNKKDFEVEISYWYMNNVQS